MTGKEEVFKRPLTVERTQFRLPSAIIKMIARVVGPRITREQLGAAIEAATRRHPLVGARIDQDADGNAWFVNDGSVRPAAEFHAATSDNDFVGHISEQDKTPILPGRGPLVRFVVLQHEGNPDQSVKSPAETEASTDVIVYAHHVMCDGISLAYLVRDLLSYLSEYETLSVDTVKPIMPIPVNDDSLPADAKAGPLVRLLTRRLNSDWAKKKHVVTDEEYLHIHED